MPIPSYGAAPISATFLVVRVLELISMLCIVGMTAHFVDKVVSTGSEPPKEVVGALSVTCVAALYCLVSVPFYWAVAYMGLLVMAAVDALLLIAFIVVAVVVGKPLSYLNCYFPRGWSSEDDAASAAAFMQNVGQSIGEEGSSLNWEYWAGTTKGNCFESKAIWGFSIALCILFTTSLVLLPTLFYKNKKANGPIKVEP